MRKLLILFFLLIIVVGAANAQLCSQNISLDAYQFAVGGADLGSSTTGTYVTYQLGETLYYIPESAEWYITYLSGKTDSYLRQYNCSNLGEIKTSSAFTAGGGIYTQTGKHVGNWQIRRVGSTLTLTAYYFADYDKSYLIYMKDRLNFKLEFGYGEHCGFNGLVMSWGPYISSADSHYVLKYLKTTKTSGSYWYAGGIRSENIGMQHPFTAVNILSGYAKADLQSANAISFEIFTYTASNFTYWDYIFYISPNNKTKLILPFSSYKFNVSMQTYELNDCFKQYETVAGLKLYVKDAAGNLIKNYAIRDNITNTVTVVTNYTANVAHLAGKTVSFTVTPLLDERLQTTVNVTVSNLNDTYITLNNLYVYNIAIIVYGALLPVAWTELGYIYTVDGIVIPDKINNKGEYVVSGFSSKSATLQIPAGDYNLTLKTSLPGVEKTRTIQLSLLDNNYYRTIIWRVSYLTDEINITVSENSKLKVIVVDQNGKAVQNVLVKLDGVSATTNEDGEAIFDVVVGQTYDVEVYVKNILKAKKTVTISNIVENLLIQITLSDEERQQLTPTPTPSQTPQTQFEVTADKIAAIMSNPAIWGLIIVIGLAIVAAANAGERIGLITFVAALGVFTYIIPLLPQVIFIIVAIVAMILFSWKVVGRLVGGGEE